MKYIGVDLECKNLKLYNATIWSLTIHEGRKTSIYEDCYGLKNVPKDVRKKLEDPNYCKIIHSSEFDGPILELILGIKMPNIWDTQVIEVVIQGIRVSSKQKKIEEGSPIDLLLRKYSSKLDYTLRRYGLKVPDKNVRNSFKDRPEGKEFTKQELAYMKDDVTELPKLQKMQEYLLLRDGLIEVGLLENKTAEKIISMRVNGIGFDSDVWRSIAAENTKEFKLRMSKLPKEVSNWNSPKQVKEYFKSKGIHIESFDELDDVYLATRNKILGDFIYARDLHKSVTSYGLNWFEDGFVDPDGRVRCNIDQCINTGRMSMSNPNLQQLPGKGNDIKHARVLDLIARQYGKHSGKMQPKHRSAFVPKKGYVFVIGDFSGQEIGIMAAASGEELWINALLRGEDIHCLTASLVSPTEWAEGTEKGCTFPKKCKCKKHLEMRDPAKVNNFMLAYGGGPEKLAVTTGMDKQAARVYVSAHKRVIPKLTRYLERNSKEALDTGVSYSADPYRRRRVLKGEESWQIANQGKNNPIQSAGANMLKLAMISMPSKYYIALVIHDEIILEVKKSEAAAAAKCLKKVMEDSANYITGIKGLIKVEPRIQMNLMKD